MERNGCNYFIRFSSNNLYHKQLRPTSYAIRQRFNIQIIIFAQRCQIGGQTLVAEQRKALVRIEQLFEFNAQTATAGPAHLEIITVILQ